MLAFMAHPPPPPVGINNSANHQPTRQLSVRSCESRATSITSASMGMDVPPQSMLSLSTEASSQAQAAQRQDDTTTCSNNVRQSLNHSVLEDDDDDNDDDEKETQQRHDNENTNETTPQDRRRHHRPTTHFIEKLYENTVDGPCQTGTLCEVQPMDLFLNCQQPLSFLGFGTHPSRDPRQTGSTSSADFDRSYHLPQDFDDDDNDDELPLPGVYAVPRGCEYCGAHHTNDCHAQTCQRPKLFFQKKRPPFAPRDASLWDPDTDNAIPAGATTAPNNTDDSGSRRPSLSSTTVDPAS